MTHHLTRTDPRRGENTTHVLCTDCHWVGPDRDMGDPHWRDLIADDCNQHEEHTLNDDVAARLAAIEETITQLTEQANQLRAHLLEHTPPGGTITVGGEPRWRVQPGRRTFKPDLATQVLNPALVAACMVPKLDGAAVKKHVPPAVYDQCCTLGQPFLTAVKR